MPLPPTYESLWTLGDVADYLQVSDRTVRRWIEDKKLTAFKVGGHWRIHRKEVDRIAFGYS